MPQRLWAVRGRARCGRPGPAPAPRPPRSSTGRRACGSSWTRATSRPRTTRAPTPSRPCWPSPEEVGATGAQLLEATAAAYEVAVRVGRAVRLRRSVHPFGTAMVCGAAAGVARLRGLDPATRDPRGARRGGPGARLDAAGREQRCDGAQRDHRADRAGRGAGGRAGPHRHLRRPARAGDGLRGGARRVVRRRRAGRRPGRDALPHHRLPQAARLQPLEPQPDRGRRDAAGGARLHRRRRRRASRWRPTTPRPGWTAPTPRPGSPASTRSRTRSRLGSCCATTGSTPTPTRPRSTPSSRR